MKRVLQMTVVFIYDAKQIDMNFGNDINAYHKRITEKIELITILNTFI